jgi:hypothetical protein
MTVGGNCGSRFDLPLNSGRGIKSDAFGISTWRLKGRKRGYRCELRSGSGGGVGVDVDLLLRDVVSIFF